MTRYKPSRESFLIAGAVKIADKASDAVAYVYERDGKLFAQVFFGKQAKPVLHCRYRDQAGREMAIRRTFEGRRASFAMKAETKSKRLAPNLLKRGDILVATWGYEQTNVDFYEVTAVSGQHVQICKIEAASEDTAYMQGRCVPQSGQFIGKAMRKLVQWGDHVTIDDCRSARKWNTSEVAGVKVGPSVAWTSHY